MAKKQKIKAVRNEVSSPQDVERLSPASGMNAITEEVHERADHLLCKATAIVNLILDSASSSDSKSRAHAAWAVSEMIEEARELYGKY